MSVKSSGLRSKARFAKVAFKLQSSKWARLNSAVLSALLVALFSAFIGPSDLPTARAAQELIPTANTWMPYYNGNYTNTPPQNRTRHVAVWDSLHNLMVVHGGFDVNGQSLNDTWKLDTLTGTWTRYTASTGSTPPTRVNACAVWDTAHNRMLVTGGSNYGPPYSALNLVWSFDPSGNGNWTVFSTPAGNAPPEGQEAQVCAWDAANNKMLVYGGLAEDTVWSFDPSASNGNGSWTEVLSANPADCTTTPPANRPGWRRYSSFVWNPVLNRMLIWGGRKQCLNTGDSFYYNDVWSFNPGNYTTDSGSWTKITTSGGSPLPRDRAGAIWDPSIQQMVIFGSVDESGNTAIYYNDVWQFKLDTTSTGHWTQRLPQGTAPGVRADGSAVYDPIHNQMLYFAGRIPVEERINELWGLGPAPTQFGLKFVNNPFSIPVGTASPALQIQLTDGSGNNTTNNTGSAITVSLSATPTPSGSCAAPGCGFSPDPNGVSPAFATTLDITIASGQGLSTIFYYRDTKAGNVTLSATAISIATGITQQETITPGAANKLVFSTQPPATTNAGATFASAPKVTVQDIYSNTVTSPAASVSLTLQGGDPTAVLNGTTTQNTVNGIATFSGLSVNKGSTTPYQLKATGNGLTPATSNNFTINTVCNPNSTIVTILGDPTLPVADPCQISLRQAIQSANTNGGTVTFAANLLTTSGTGALQTISLTSALPALTANVKINAGCNTTAIVGRGRPTIAIDGTSAGANASGFTLNAGTQTATPGNGNTLNGLAIVNFKGYGVDISSTGNIITCSYIGTDNGTSAKPNLSGGINLSGVAAQGATGATASNSFGLANSSVSGNLIAGVGGANSKSAIRADGLGAKNYLYYNYINYNAAGTDPLTGSQVSQLTPLKSGNRARLIIKQGNKERR